MTRWSYLLNLIRRFSSRCAALRFCCTHNLTARGCVDYYDYGYCAGYLGARVGVKAKS